MSDAGLTLCEHRHRVWEDADSGLHLDAAPEPSDGFVRLVEQTLFGGSGLRYRRLAVADALARTHGATCLSLSRHNELIGTYVLEHKSLAAAERTIDGVYRSLLCIAPEAQGQGFGQLMVKRSLAWLDQKARHSSQPLISFGCIESSNTRSLALLKSTGATEIGSLHTQMVYRQWPRRKVAIERLDASTDSRVHRALIDAYRDCGLTYAAPQDNAFFAVTDNNSLVAGAHARVVRINFDRIGQPWDFLSEHVFARIGPARRRFNPRSFAYLKLDGVVAAPDSARVWRDFISTLLTEHDVYMAMFALDPTSRISRRLGEAGVFGRIARSTRQQLVVVASDHSTTGQPLQGLVDAPLGVGPFGH